MCKITQVNTFTYSPLNMRFLIMNKTKFNITEAAKIAGVTRKTFYQHINKKGISTSADDNGKTLIDASELIRIYGDKCKFDGDKEKIGGSFTKEAVGNTTTQVETKLLEQELKMTRQAKDSEISRLEDHIEALEKRISEQKSQFTMLLEDKRAGGNEENKWEKAINAIEKRVANQESRAQNEKERADKILKQNLFLKKQLEEEKNKSFLKKLFG